MAYIEELAVTRTAPGRSAPGFYKGSHSIDFHGYRLYTAFQPVYSFSHRRKVGLEALVRGVDSSGKAVPPWKLFGSAQPMELIDLDLMLTEVHLDNFTSLDMKNYWLFLNVNPGSIAAIDTYTTHLRRLLQQTGVPAHRVVIEVLETAFSDETLLEGSIRKLKDLGCMIAIDDFGAGHSNFERVWRMEPDIVKFDQTMIKRAARDKSVQVMMKGIVDILHTKKCIVLAEGIETFKEAVTAMDANIDLGQGFLLTKPYPISDPVPRIDAVWDNIYQAYEHHTRKNAHGYIDEIKQYIKGFRNMLPELEENTNLRTVSGDMLALPRTMRLYVLNQDGSQLSANVEADKRTGFVDKKMEPLYQAAGAKWHLRPYYRNAVNNPDELQITPPYLSITDAELCITLSQTIRMNGEMHILCCDLKWDY